MLVSPTANSQQPTASSEQPAAKSEKLHPNSGSNANDTAGRFAQENRLPRDRDNHPRPDRVADAHNRTIENGQPAILIDEYGVDSRQRLVERSGRR